MDYAAQILVNGLHNGMVYATLAWSYVLVQGITHRPNLVHGALFAFSGQVFALAVVQGYVILWMTFTAAILFGIFASLALSGIFVVAIAITVMAPLAGRAPNTMLVATLGLMIAITEAAHLASDTRELWIPPLTDARVTFSFLPGSPAMTLVQALSCILLGFLLAASELVLRKTAAGRNVRAVSDDPQAARLMGVNAGRTLVLTIVAGGMLAAATGTVAVLHYGNMSFGSGLAFSLKILFIASAGGFNAPLSAAAAAFAYAGAEAFWDGYMPTQWRDAMFFAALATILILRPQNAEKPV